MVIVRKSRQILGIETSVETLESRRMLNASMDIPYSSIGTISVGANGSPTVFAMPTPLISIQSSETAFVEFSWSDIESEFQGAQSSGEKLDSAVLSLENQNYYGTVPISSTVTISGYEDSGNSGITPSSYTSPAQKIGSFDLVDQPYWRQGTLSSGRVPDPLVSDGSQTDYATSTPIDKSTYVPPKIYTTDVTQFLKSESLQNLGGQVGFKLQAPDLKTPVAFIQFDPVQLAVLTLNFEKDTDPKPPVETHPTPTPIIPAVLAPAPMPVVTTPVLPTRPIQPIKITMIGANDPKSNNANATRAVIEQLAPISDATGVFDDTENLVNDVIQISKEKNAKIQELVIVDHGDSTGQNLGRDSFGAKIDYLGKNKIDRKHVISTKIASLASYFSLDTNSQLVLDGCEVGQAKPLILRLSALLPGVTVNAYTWRQIQPLASFAHLGHKVSALNGKIIH